MADRVLGGMGVSSPLSLAPQEAAYRVKCSHTDQLGIVEVVSGRERAPRYLPVGSTLAWVILALAIGVNTPDAVSAEEVLTILHTSEHHGHVLPIELMGRPSEGGMARRATVIADLRRTQPAVLLLDSGDLLIGTPMSSVFRGEPDLKAMNLMGYDAMAAGNHEFDFGLDHLRVMHGWAGFPILCSNLDGRGIELPCRESTVVRAGNLSVGVMGLLGKRNFPDTFNRDVVSQLTLRDPLETVRRVARELRARDGTDLVVAVTHQDDEEDLALLAQASELDAIIGGHTPGFDGLRTAPQVAPVQAAERPGTVFVKTHRQGRTVGRLDLVIEPSPDKSARAVVLRAEARNLPVGEVLASDATVAELVEQYTHKLAQLGSTVVGRAARHLDGETAEVRVRETNLGNLLADLAREEFEADVALVNSGQIRDSIPAGPVDLTRVLRVLPFNSTLVTVTLLGQDLWAALENSVSRLPAANGRFLQVSGLRVTYDAEAPIGSRVRQVLVGSKALDPTARYVVVTDRFLADGGDGYAMFARAQDRIERQVPLRDLLLRRLKSSALNATVEQRIVPAGSSASSWLPSSRRMCAMASSPCRMGVRDRMQARGEDSRGAEREKVADRSNGS